MISDKQGLEWLQAKLKTLKRRTLLFNLLKKELSGYGYWKNKVRGDGGKRFIQNSINTIWSAKMIVVYIMDIIRQPKMTKYKAYIELLKHFKHLQIYFKPHKGIF